MSPHRVAIIADAHFHDPRGNFGGAGIMQGGGLFALRGWADVKQAPRAVNETATALRAALARISAMGIRHVILAGDYTDDGQAENTRCLARLLQDSETTLGLRFYAIPGNHDAYGPCGKHVTTRFITGQDTSVMVTSDPASAATHGPDTVLTPAMRCMGLPQALHHMARFGLYRQPEHLHWESPFGLSDNDAQRVYHAQAADASVTHRLMDASYLVEPEPGLWLLMIDANVFEPRPGITDPARKKAFFDASDAGWNAALRGKPHLLPWIADVTARARRRGITLVTVSHYPVLDPFQDLAGSEAALFGNTAIVRRTPAPAVAQALASAGLHWHAGGHMHVSTSHCVQTASGPITDVALPALSAFPPAFTMVEATPQTTTARSILLTDVPADPDVHAIYQMQTRADLPHQDYATFLARQFRAHVTQRILPRDWPADLMPALADASCADLLGLLGHQDPIAFASRHGLAPDALTKTPVVDLITDAYVIRNAGPLATGFVSPARISLCHALATEYGDETQLPGASHAAFLQRFLAVLHVSLHRMTAHTSITG